MVNKLFDDFERTDINRDNFVVEHYTFLNTSAIDEAERARKKINLWSDGFPVTTEFLKRFRSKNNKQHTAALFELYIFHYFRNKGFPIEALDRGKVATPDFKVSIDGKTVYVECTCSSNSGITDTIEELQSVILDSFKKIDKQEYFINIEWLTCAPNTPSLKKILSSYTELYKRSASSQATIYRRWWLENQHHLIVSSRHPLSEGSDLCRTLHRLLHLI
ncbi:hypothetical protein ACRQ5D_31185 [Mucilaginibacter sp. P25]|uniref:hypothetical protein n=1 Tax=Mucilaginibacter sp. P25 TaxID=3423945 RepID=UPI003D78E11B